MNFDTFTGWPLTIFTGWPLTIHYLQGDLCQWRILATHGEKIILNITSLDIPASVNCQLDYLEVRTFRELKYHTMYPRHMNSYQESYSQHFQDQMPRENEFTKSMAVLHISGLLIYLELKIKSSIKKLLTLQWYLDIFSQSVFNPLKLRTSQQLSFCADQHLYIFINKFQDDISCALAMYSYTWDWLYFFNLYIGERLYILCLSVRL